MPPIEIPPVLTGNLEQYRLVSEIQQCLYGCVFKGVALTTGAVVAIKIFSKCEIAKKESETDLPETPLAEVFFATLTASASEYLTTPREVFHDENFHFVVSDFARGEDLLELLKLFPQGMPEPQAKFYIRQATEALMECHRRDFAMQDFSLENCLLFKKGERGGPFYFSVRVCDPGQAILFRRHPSGRELRVPYRGCVGKKFRPPEVFERKPYLATKIDSWDLGWACYYLLFARQIVGSCDERDEDWRFELFRKGRIAELMDRNEISKPWTNEALDFILKLMRLDPCERMDIADALQHPWLDPNHAIPIAFFDLRPKCSIEHDLILQAHLRNVDDKACSEKVKSIQERIKQGPAIPEAYRKQFMKQLCLYYKPSGHTLGQLEGLRDSIALPDKRTAAAEPLLSLSTIPKEEWTKTFNPTPMIHSYNGAVLTFPKTPLPVDPPPLFPDQPQSQSPPLTHVPGVPTSSSPQCHPAIPSHPGQPLAGAAAHARGSRAHLPRSPQRPEAVPDSAMTSQAQEAKASPTTGTRLPPGGGGASSFRQTPPPQEQQSGRTKPAVASPVVERLERVPGEGQRVHVQVRLLPDAPQAVTVGGPGRGRLRGREMVGPVGGPRRHAQTVEPGRRVGRGAVTLVGPGMPLRTSGSPSLGPCRSLLAGPGEAGPGPTGSLPLRPHLPGGYESVGLSLSPSQKDRIRSAMEAQMVAAGRGQRGGGSADEPASSSAIIQRVPVGVDSLQLPPSGLCEDGSSPSNAPQQHGARPLPLPGHAATLHSWGGGGNGAAGTSSVFLCIHPQQTEYGARPGPQAAHPHLAASSHPLPLIPSDTVSTFTAVRPETQVGTAGSSVRMIDRARSKGEKENERGRALVGLKRGRAAPQGHREKQPKPFNPPGSHAVEEMAASSSAQPPVAARSRDRLYGGGGRMPAPLTPNPFAPEGRRRASSVHPPGFSTVPPQPPASSVLIRKLRAQRRGAEGARGVSPSRRAKSPLRVGGEEQGGEGGGWKQGNEGRRRALEMIAEADEKEKGERKVCSPTAASLPLPFAFADAPSEATRKGAERRFRRLIPGASATVHVHGGPGKAPENGGARVGAFLRESHAVPSASASGAPRRSASPSPSPAPAARPKETKPNLPGALPRGKGRGTVSAAAKKAAAEAADRRKNNPPRAPPPTRGRTKQSVASRGAAAGSKGASSAAASSAASGRGVLLKEKEKAKGLTGVVPRKDTIAGAVLRAVRGEGGMDRGRSHHLTRGSSNGQSVSAASRSSRAPSASGPRSRAGAQAKKPRSPGAPVPSSGGLRRGGRGRGRGVDRSRQAAVPPVPGASRPKEAKGAGEGASSSSSATAGMEEKEKEVGWEEGERERERGSIGGTGSSAGLSLLKHGSEDGGQPSSVPAPAPEAVSFEGQAPGAEVERGGVMGGDGVVEEGMGKDESVLLSRVDAPREEKEKEAQDEMYKVEERLVDDSVDGEGHQADSHGRNKEERRIQEASQNDTSILPVEAGVQVSRVATPPALVIPLQALQQRFGQQLCSSFHLHQPNLSGRTDTRLPARSTHNPDGRPSPLPSPAQSPGSSLPLPPAGGIPPLSLTAVPLSSSTANITAAAAPQGRAVSVFPHYDTASKRMLAASQDAASLSSRVPADSAPSAASHAHTVSRHHVLHAPPGHSTGNTPIPFPNPLTQQQQPLQSGPLSGSTAALSTAALHSMAVPQQPPPQGTGASGRSVSAAFGGPYRIPLVSQIHQHAHFLHQGPPVTHRDRPLADASPREDERERAAGRGRGVLFAALQLASPRRPAGSARRTDAIPPRPVPPERPPRAVGSAGVVPAAPGVGMPAGDVAFLRSQGGGEKMPGGERSGVLTARASRSDWSKGEEGVWFSSYAPDGLRASASSTLQRQAQTGGALPNPSPSLLTEGRASSHIFSNCLANGFMGEARGESVGLTASSSTLPQTASAGPNFPLRHQQENSGGIPPLSRTPFVPLVPHWQNPHHYPQQQQQQQAMMYGGKGAAPGGQWQQPVTGVPVVVGRFSTPEGRGRAGAAHPAGLPLPTVPGPARGGAPVAFAVPMPGGVPSGLPRGP